MEAVTKETSGFPFWLPGGTCLDAVGKKRVFGAVGVCPRLCSFVLVCPAARREGGGDPTWILGRLVLHVEQQKWGEERTSFAASCLLLPMLRSLLYASQTPALPEHLLFGNSLPSNLLYTNPNLLSWDLQPLLTNPGLSPLAIWRGSQAPHSPPNPMAVTTQEPL